MSSELQAGEYLGRVAFRVNPRLERIVAEQTRPSPSRLAEAMGYALLGPGKRLRPALVLAAAEAVGGEAGDESLAMRYALALEMVHAYSLVHDDLPCMDDDDLRRGRPTVHKAYDEATAVLVGDGLQSLAFQVLLGSGHPRSAELAALLAGNALLMVQGQALDVEAQGPAPRSDDAAQILNLMGKKTAALIAAAVAGGAVAATGSSRDLYPVGWKLGLAFQITDDLLDLTAGSADLGKRAGKDAAAGKATLPALLGVEEARLRAEAYAGEVEAALAPLGGRAGPLRLLARFAVTRRR